MNVEIKEQITTSSAQQQPGDEPAFTAASAPASGLALFLSKMAVSGTFIFLVWRVALELVVIHGTYTSNILV